MNSKLPNWPSWRYHPVTGEGKIFQRKEDVPKGWVDSPAKKGKTKNNRKAGEDQSASPKEPSKENPTAREDLMNLPMHELWKKAADLGVDKSGTKEELVERILQTQPKTT